MPLTLQVIQCLALVAVLATSVAVWLRLRALPPSETARRLRELTDRQCDLEAHLMRVEEELATRPAAPARRFDPPAPSALSGPTLIAVPNLSVPHTEASAAAAAELGRRFGSIWVQADAGASAETIAQRTGQPVGQVALILGLRRQLSPRAAATTPGGRS